MAKRTNIVTGLYGWKGAGKTLIMTLFLYLEYLADRHVYNNYQLEFEFEWLKGHDMVELASHLSNAAVGIDELHEYADCRNSGTLQNKRVSDFFLQSRHRNANIYYTTQYKDQVDKRIRRITDIDIICENLHIDSDQDGDEDMFRFTMKDCRITPPVIITRTLYAKPLFDMYDSGEIINPFTYKKKKEVKKLA